MRGTRLCHFLACELDGIIPAYAGNTHGCTRQAHPARDHPRVCGEHQPIGRKFHPITGSSPRMRGTRNLAGECDGDIGIIPAYAGNTGNTHTSTQQDRDHPRVCGEHQLGPVRDLEPTGSSPRMRGTPETPSFSGIRLGIIPAYAGNTTASSRITSRITDHPRVCGEHSMLNAAASASTGSSPRMRGTLDADSAVVGNVGIIPAYAGNTANCGATGLVHGDHPRVCGEHLLSFFPLY